MDKDIVISSSTAAWALQALRNQEIYLRNQADCPLITGAAKEGFMRAARAMAQACEELEQQQLAVAQVESAIGRVLAKLETSALPVPQVSVLVDEADCTKFYLQVLLPPGWPPFAELISSRVLQTLANAVGDKFYAKPLSSEHLRALGDSLNERLKKLATTGGLVADSEGVWDFAPPSDPSTACPKCGADLAWSMASTTPGTQASARCTRGMYVSDREISELCTFQGIVERMADGSVVLAPAAEAG